MYLASNGQACRPEVPQKCRDSSVCLMFGIHSPNDRTKVYREQIKRFISVDESSSGAFDCIGNGIELYKIDKCSLKVNNIFNFGYYQKDFGIRSNSFREEIVATAKSIFRYIFR